MFGVGCQLNRTIVKIHCSSYELGKKLELWSFGAFASFASIAAGVALWTRSLGSNVHPVRYQVMGTPQSIKSIDQAKLRFLGL
jgi:hypothetical protein